MRLNIKSKFGATFLFLAALAMSGFSLSLLIADPASLSGRYSLSLFGAMLPLSILYMGRAFKKRKAAPLPDPTANKVFQRSRLETLCFIICGAGFVIGAYGLTSGSIPSDSADDSWLKPSWGMYFFGACLLVFLWMLVTGGAATDIVAERHPSALPSHPAHTLGRYSRCKYWSIHFTGIRRSPALRAGHLSEADAPPFSLGKFDEQQAGRASIFPDAGHVRHHHRRSDRRS